MKTPAILLATILLAGCATGKHSNVTVTAPITLPLPPGFKITKQPAPPPTPPGAKPKAKALARQSLTPALAKQAIAPAAVDNSFALTNTTVAYYEGQKYLVSQFLAKANRRHFVVFGENLPGFPWQALEVGCYPVDQDVYVAGNWPENFPQGFYNGYYEPCTNQTFSPASAVAFGGTLIVKGVKLREVIGGMQFTKSAGVRFFIKAP